VTALLINLPFILWNYHAWIAGVMAPMADPMFPQGVGIVGLSTTPLLPFLPQIAYNILELGVMLLALLWYWRLCKERPEAAMVLAIIPLFFAWRSLSSYFYCAALPLIVLMAARSLASKRRYTRPILDQAMLVVEQHESELNDLPTPVGVHVAILWVEFCLTWANTKLAFVWRSLNSTIVTSPRSAPPPHRG